VVDDAAIPTPTRMAADAAYEQAGIGPSDVQIAEVQDTDAARELLAYEELGFCDAGEAGAWFAAGHSQRDGNLPVNVSGGLLSKGEPLGASALGHVVELTRQLRGEAGPRQVEGVRVGLAHNVGRGANASVSILST
jgi:acetyl-CoA acetyltransferase